MEGKKENMHIYPNLSPTFIRIRSGQDVLHIFNFICIYLFRGWIPVHCALNLSFAATDEPGPETFNSNVVIVAYLYLRK